MSIGVSAPALADRSGASYRQVDYWARTGILVPSLRTASGTGRGRERIYSGDQIEVARVLALLSAAGFWPTPEASRCVAESVRAGRRSATWTSDDLCVSVDWSQKRKEPRTG